MSAKAHLVLIVISAVVCAFLTAVLADGRSIIVLKDGALPVVTNPAIVSADLKFLLGQTYGVGLHHDSTGRYWTEVDPAYGTLPDLLAALGAPGVLAALPTAISANALKHPVEFLQCKDLQTAGIVAMVIAFIGLGSSFIMIIFHSAALAGFLSPKAAKYFALLMWSIFVVAFLVVIVLGFQVFSSTWTCGNPVIPTLKLNDSFDLSYGIPFAIIGLVASVIALLITVLGTSKVGNGASKSGVASAA